MRLNPILFSAPSRTNARRPQREPVPFQMLLPLKLRKAVSGKNDKVRESSCMQEMAVMFACFKKNEFEQEKCLKEVSDFKSCFNNYRETQTAAREQGKKGILVPGETTMTHRQLNQLLRRFPPLK